RRDPDHPGRLLVEPEQARIVRKMFGWLVDRERTTRSIVRELNRLGIPSPSGQTWAISTVAKMLRSSVYKGAAHWGEITIDIPALINAAIYDRAQAQLQRNRIRYQGRPAGRVYTLKGLVLCGTGGRRMPGWPAKRVPYYRCTGANGLAP